MKKSYIFIFLAILLFGTTYFLFLRDSSMHTSQLVQTENGLIEKNYDLTTKEISLTNDLTKEQILTAKLDTPQDYRVGAGYQKVAEIEFTSYEDFKQYLSENYFELIDLNTGKQTQRQLDFKYKTNKDISIDDYAESCITQTILKNGTEIKSCSQVLIGNHLENQEVWEDINNYVFKSGEPVKIGIFTDVQVNDKVEWIPTFYGVQISEWATWTASLNVGLQAYWAMNESSGTILVESTNNLGSNGSLKNTNDTNWVAGKIGNALFFNGSSQWANTTFRTTYSSSTDFTYNFWVNTNNTNPASEEYFGTLDTVTGAGIGMDYLTCGTGLCARYRVRNDSGVDKFLTTPDRVNTSLWQMHTIVRDTTNNQLRLYVNGTSMANTTESPLGTITFSKTSIALGARNQEPPAGTFTDVSFDEFGIWNRSLTQTEVTQLYNSGNGISWQPTNVTTSSASINLVSPANNSNLSSSTNYFVSTVNTTGAITIVNVSFVLNGTVNQTNSSGLLGTYNFTQILGNGNYNWTTIIYGNDSKRYNATNGTLFFVVDTISPIVDITSPAQTTYPPGTMSVALNFVLVEANPNRCWYILNAGSNTSIANCANTTLSGLTDGQYNFSLYANDTAGNSGSDNVSFIIGSIINVTLISPSNSSAIITTPIYFVSNLTSAFMNISNATLYIWYENGTLASSNFTTMNSNNIQLNLSISDVTTIGFYKWNVVGRGTSLGDLISGYAADNFTFVIGTSINNVTYNFTTFETKREVFKATVSLPVGVNMQEAILVYNGTEYGVDSIISSGSNVILSRTIDIPLNINATNNETKYFYWIFNMLQGSLSANQTSDIYNNTVYYIYLTLNSSAYKQLALNFTGREEQNNTIINISVEANLQYHVYDSTGTVVKIFNLTDVNENLSNYKLSIFPSNQTFKVSNVLSYYKASYDRREYFFDNATISNITQNINLYLLPTSISDLVTFQVLDENDAPVENAFIYIQKWNIGENTFSTINILNTQEEGRATANLKLNDLFYRYIVVYNGITYLTTPAAKEVQTSRLLRITINPLPDYSTFGSVSTTLSFNNATNVTALVYTDTSGAVAQGCLKITDNSGSTIFYDCVDGVSGSITYQIVQNGSFIASSIITLIESEGAISKVVDVLFIRVGIPEKFEIIGKYGQAISFVLIGTAALIGVAVGSIILGLFLMVAAGGFVYMLGFLNFGSSMFLFISLILLIILTSIRRR